MKDLTRLLAIALLACAHAAYSQDVYVLRFEGDAHSVTRVSQKAVANVLTVGRVAVYGASDRAMAVLSHKVAAGGYVLDIVDLSSGALSASWPIGAEPVMQLSGPSRDIVLSDAFAYFLSIEHSNVGASFHFNQLSLADGSVRTLPLPRRFANPRLTDFEGTPLLYSWNGFGVMRFDPLTQKFEDLVSRVDVAEVISAEEMAKRSGQISTFAVADHVAVSGAGVFRLSKLGNLHQVLNPELSPIDTDRSIPLGPAENILKLFATSFDDRPAIGVVRKVDDRLRLAYIDAERLSIISERALPGGVVLQSIVGSTHNATFYVDRSAGSIKRITKRAATTVSRLPASQVAGARIVTVSGS